MPKIKKRPIESIPIVIPSADQAAKIGKLVDKAVKQKLHDSLSDISSLEKAIDETIFRLYDLTDDEIDMVCQKIAD